MTTIVMLPTPPAAQPARSAQPSRSGASGAAADRDFARTLDEVSGRQDRTAHDDAAPADVPEDAPAADAAPVEGSDERADATGARPEGEAARPDGESARPAALLLSIAQIVQSAAGALDAAAGSRPVDAAAVLAAGVPVADAQVPGTGGATVTTAAASADAEAALAPVIDLASRRAPHVPTQRGAGGQPGAAGAAGPAGDATGVRPAVDPATLGAPPAPVLGADAPTGAPRLFAVEAPSVPGVPADAPAPTAADGAPAVRAAEATVASPTTTQAPSAAVGVSPTAAPSATTATTATSAPAAPQAPADVPLAEQLSGRLTSLRSAGPGQHVLTLRVDPESIGPVRVVAHIGAEGVRIELFGATDQAREALRQAMPDLRRDLVAAGLPGGLDLGTGSGPGLRGQGTGTGTGGSTSGQGGAPGDGGPGHPGAEAGAPQTTPTTGGHAAHLDLLV
jgi:flagellar hook-length control protein FliK